jgi:hypothetical protein
MNRSKLILSLLIAILLLVAAIFFWNPGGDEPLNTEFDAGVEQDDSQLDPAVAEMDGQQAASNGEGREASDTTQQNLGTVARAAAEGGGYQIRALSSSGAPAPGARFLIENRDWEIEWIESDSGVLKLPDFGMVREVAAFADGMWSEPRSIDSSTAQSLDLMLEIQAGSVNVEVSRQGQGSEAEFLCFHRFRDEPQDLGETLAAVFQPTDDSVPALSEANADLFHLAFRVEDPTDPRSQGRNGRVELRDLPPGFYTFRAQSTWGVLQTETVELKPGGHQDVSLELPTGGHLSGRVIDADGNPLEQATVMFRPTENNLVDAISKRRVRLILNSSYDDDPRSDLAHTDENGEFTMGPVPTGEGILAAGKEGLLPKIVSNVVIDGEQEQKLEDITLGGGHSVAILVRDAATGEVLQNAIAAWQVAGNDIGLLAMGSWEIGDPKDRDAQGHVILRNLPFERLSVRVQAEGYARKETDYLMPEESWISGGELPVLEVSLKPGLRLHGTVRDALTGEPVPEVEVLALDSDNQSALPGLMARLGSASYPTTDSDEDGNFEFVDLPASDYVLQAQHADYAPMRSEITPLAEGMEPQVQLLLRPGATLIAHYIGTDGNSEANRSIILVHLELGSTQTQTTNEEGMAHFKGLPAGNMQIATLPGDANPEEVGQGNLDLDFIFVELTEGETRIVELGPGLSQCKVQGRLTRGGAPVAGKSVTLLGTSGLKATKSSEDGEFELDGLRAGSYSYLVGEQASPALVGTVNIEIGTNALEIELPDGGITATILKSTDRSPVVGMTVTITANNTRGGPLFAMTDGKGMVHFPDLEPGLYQVNAGKASLPILGGDDSLGSTIVDVQVEKQQAEIEILLEPGATFRARVLGTDGNPVSGANLYYLRSDGMPLSQLSVKGTNSKGVAQLTGLPSGPGLIAIRHPEFGQAEIAVSLSAGELSKQEVKLQTGTKVYIQVTDESDQNLPGILAVLDDSRGARTSWLFSMSESQDYNRSYFSGTEQKFGPLPAGDYTLRLFRLGGKVVEYKMQIPPDTPELRLRYAYNP